MAQRIRRTTSERAIILAGFAIALVAGTWNLVLRRDLALDTRATAGGIVVTGVRPGSQAAASGLQVGDRLISASGHPLVTPAVLHWHFGVGPPPESLSLEIVR